MNLKELEQYFINFYVRPYQAKRKAKEIINWNGKSEFGGQIYDELREIGVDIISAYKIQTISWGICDKIHGTTPWEEGLLNFIEGKSKIKYNQIPLI